MSKRKHDQRPAQYLMVCPRCKEDKCEECVDRLRAIYASNLLCKCSRKLHNEKMSGEPILNQIRDPETGAVYAPGLEVSQEGEVKFNDRG